MSHDPAATPCPPFPRLTPANHSVTSPADGQYNCIAWAAGDMSRWWQPFIYWPDPAGKNEYGVDDLMRVLGTVGYVRYGPTEPPAGLDVIAVYATDWDEYQHAARRLPDGRWTSKLGDWEDIQHDTTDAVAGGDYGEVVVYLTRP